MLRKELFAGPAQVSRSDGLSLRTENLIVSVELWDEREAAKIAEAAVKAVPVQDPD
ncbi:hypothetical protein [Streptomyces sp. NPDC004291]